MIFPERHRDSSQNRAIRHISSVQDATSNPTNDRPPAVPPLEHSTTSEATDPTLPQLRQNAAAPSHSDGGLRPPGGGRFHREPHDIPAPSSRSTSQSPLRLSMPSISPGQLAFSAMQYLPIPTIVLSNLKTVVLANEAVGRMMGLVPEDGGADDAPPTIERLRGQTLSQIGIDMLQEGRPVWVTWDTFLDSLVREMGVRPSTSTSRPASLSGGEATPTVGTMGPPDGRPGATNRPTQDAVVEVVISQKDINKTTFDSRYKSKESQYQVFAKLIITIWEVEDRQTYFTLTFTSTSSTPTTTVNNKRAIAKPSTLEAADRRSIVHSSASSVGSSRDPNSPSFSSPSFYSPNVITMSSSPFPPMGPPTVASQSNTPSLLQKMILMKDALLDNSQMPVFAMWKDGSVTFPNKAARRLFHSDADFDLSADGFDLLKSWQLWNEDFTERLGVHDYPISVLIRTESPFDSIRVGMYDERGKKVVLDVIGEVIRDDSTGEFLAGVVSGRDVTVMTEEIEQIKERDEERFRLICDTMPQLVFTATPDGTYDFFNTRWEAYTGLTPEECLRLGWQSLFHPDDIPETLIRWNESLRTGEPFMTEYRCRGRDGQWRWYLGRALAVRNKETGEIEKWFGTCTDVHESTATKLSAERTRQQLLSVIAHSHVTIFTVDLNRRVTMLEGALIWNNTYDESGDGRWFIGENMYKVFNRLTEQLRDGELPEWLKHIEDVLEGNVAEDVREHGLDDRWYRTRFLPMHRKVTQDGKPTNEICVEGVIGLVMDVTEMKVKEEALQKQSKEKRKAMANEAAAKEATRLKSQFLANMSHEIRTPITGVLGMAELLGCMELDDEQREYVDNIQSSATSLLTVINDILDFSKVESGRLDIEEVQFSLSLIVKEVGRMLQFAVERKNLDFQSDIGGDIENDMVVIGDPGRVRQIITNLLTNSIKFTTQGHVRFSVVKEKETADSVEVRFVVADTGIGIQDEVHKKLFQPFSQGDASTARRFGGTGLGLTICKNLLDLMHGHITLESTVGKGTTATFWVPFNKPHGTSGPSLAQTGAIPDRLQYELSLSCNSSEFEQLSGISDGAQISSSAPRRRHSIRTPPNVDQELPRADRAKVHILVVEDNPVNQKIATKTISRLGFPVTAAWNGKEALEYLMAASQGQNTKPDIILMDVQMPIIDGYKCTHLLRHHFPYKTFVQDVPIVAMTASAIQGDREKCTKAGMDDYLPKPVTMTILEKMLVRWCLSRRRDSVLQSDPSASDCSETGEHCDNADIPHVGIEDGDPDLARQNSEPITPRPLTANGQNEPSPFDSPAAPELAPQIRRPEKEKEMSSRLQETKLIDAAGGPRFFRTSSFHEPKPGEALTEENVNKLKSENQQPRR